MVKVADSRKKVDLACDVVGFKRSTYSPAKYSSIAVESLTSEEMLTCVESGQESNNPGVRCPLYNNYLGNDIMAQCQLMDT